MKINHRFLGAILLAIMLVSLVGLPASAQTTRTQVTGTCLILAEEPPSPDVREWYTGQNELHVRNDIIAFDCDYSDDRLKGNLMSVINWDVKVFYDPSWYVIGHDYGQVTITDENGDLLWEGFRNTFYTAPWIFNGTIILHGRGEFSGLMFQTDVWGDLNVGNTVELSGEVINPGN